MKVFVTGATGFIGYHVAKQLREKGHVVRALVRTETDTSLLKQLEVELIHGDIRESGCLARGMAGCEQVYHAAADYRLWAPDSRAMYETNVQGTRNVLRAARETSVERVVYTSTAGLLRASSAKTAADENARAAYGDMVGPYKKSKFLAEREVQTFLQTGLDIVIVQPTAPIGAFDRKPTPTGRIILDFLNKKIPAYLDTGLNIVDVEDVAAGHLLAAQYGKTGEHYILGHQNLSLREFLACLAQEIGVEPPNLRLPYWPVFMAACMNEALAWATGTEPRIPLDGVKLARNYMYVQSAKAVAQLRLPQSPIDQAVRKAVHWFQANGYVYAKSEQGRQTLFGTRSRLPA